jgi:hypothetical protein
MIYSNSSNTMRLMALSSAPIIGSRSWENFQWVYPCDATTANHCRPRGPRVQLSLNRGSESLTATSPHPNSLPPPGRGSTIRLGGAVSNPRLPMPNRQYLLPWLLHLAPCDYCYTKASLLLTSEETLLLAEARRGA